MPALFRSALAGLLVISGAALVSQDKLTIVDESYRIHLLDPRRTTISHFGAQVAPWQRANPRLSAGFDTDCAVLRVEMTRMEAKMHAMAEHILAMEQENTLLKERLARVKRAVDM